MMFWAFVGAIALLCVWILLQPALGKTPRALARRDSALAILEDQLAEVERDEARSVIAEPDARAAALEIKRRMIVLGKDGEKDAGAGGRWLVVSAAVVAPVAAIALYLQLGEPSTPSIPIADRAAERQQIAEVSELAERMRTQLASDPESLTEGWVLLGQTYMRMARYADAASAFGNVINRPDARTDTLSRYGEALVAAERGTVTPKAAAAFDRALQMDPRNPAAIYYQALAREQAGDVDGAFMTLKRRLEGAQSGAPWIRSFVERANALATRIGVAPLELEDYGAPRMTTAAEARGPNAAQVEAAGRMSDDQRAQFIRSMVDRLADRLETQPDDLDGWLRLANAYTVLGERAAARSAYRRAETLLTSLPPDDPRRTTVANALASLASGQ